MPALFHATINDARLTMINRGIRCRARKRRNVNVDKVEWLQNPKCRNQYSSHLEDPLPRTSSWRATSLRRYISFSECVIPPNRRRAAARVWLKELKEKFISVYSRKIQNVQLPREDTNYAYNSCFTVNNRPYCQVEAHGPCRRALSLYNDLDPTNGVTANVHTAFTIHRSPFFSRTARLQRVYTFSGRNFQ